VRQSIDSGQDNAKLSLCGMTKAIIGESGPSSHIAETEPAELAKAQVHATLAVADAISAVSGAIARTYQQETRYAE
jgi:hypothetical protein